MAPYITSRIWGSQSGWYKTAWSRHQADLSTSCPVHTDVLHAIFFGPEDNGEMFPPNMALYPIIYGSSHYTFQLYNEIKMFISYYSLNFEQMKSLLMLSWLGIIQFTNSPGYVLDDMVRFPVGVCILIAVEINQLWAYLTGFGFPILFVWQDGRSIKQTTTHNQCLR